MPAEAPPMESTTTETAQEILNIEQRSQETTGEGFLNVISEAIDKTLPNGVPPQEQPAPKEPTPKEPKREALKLPIPESLLASPKDKTAPKDAASPENEKAWLDEQTQDMKPDAKSRFTSIHARAVKAEKAAAAQEARLKELEAKSGTTSDSELETLRQERDHLDEIVKQTKLERHPKFKDAYDGEINRQLKAAKAIAGDKLGKDVTAALESGDDEKWTEVAEKLGPMKSAQIAAISAHVEKLKIDKAEQLENWKENYSKVEELEAKGREKAVTHYKAAMDKAVASVLTGVQHPEKGLEIFRKVDGNDDWNSEVEQRLSRVREIALADLTPDDKAQLAMQAVGAEKYQVLFHHFAKANALLIEALQKYRAGEPSFDGGEGARDVSGRENMGFIDATISELQNLGVIK